MKPERTVDAERAGTGEGRVDEVEVGRHQLRGCIGQRHGVISQPVVSGTVEHVAAREAVRLRLERQIGSRRGREVRVGNRPAAEKSQDACLHQDRAGVVQRGLQVILRAVDFPDRARVDEG